MEKRQNSLGVACFVLGVVGLVLCMVGVGKYLGIIGLILGIVGIFLKNRKKGLNIAGLIICSFACIIGSVFNDMWSGIGKDVDEALATDVPKKVLKSGQKSKAEKSKKEEFKIGDTVEIGSVRITFLKFEDYKDDTGIYKPKKNNKFVKADFEVENTKNDDVYVSSTDFKMYADKYATETEYLLGKLELDATISKGKKTKGSVCFQIPKKAKVLSIEYTPDLVSSKVIFKCEK